MLSALKKCDIMHRYSEFLVLVVDSRGALRAIFVEGTEAWCGLVALLSNPFCCALV